MLRRWDQVSCQNELSSLMHTGQTNCCKLKPLQPVPRVTGLQARDLDCRMFAGSAVSQLQNATVVLTDAVLPATKQEVKKEQAQIDAINLRLSTQQSVRCSLQVCLENVSVLQMSATEAFQLRREALCVESM